LLLLRLLLLNIEVLLRLLLLSIEVLLWLHRIQRLLQWRGELEGLLGHVAQGHGHLLG